jgi:hypothetical protein
MGPIGFTERSVRNYHYLLRNIPKEHSSHLESNPLTTAARYEFQISFCVEASTIKLAGIWAPHNAPI